MLHRFLTLTQIPELRTEPGNPDGGVMDIEVRIPPEVLWQAEEMIRELKYLKSAGLSTLRLSKKLNQLLVPYILYERDRTAFLKPEGAA
jgi:hypothetical protein